MTNGDWKVIVRLSHYAARGAMQKLVTIYLDTFAYMGGKWLAASHGERHGAVEEHLHEYLEAGWRIVSVSGMGGASDSVNARGWFAVVLENDRVK